MNPSGPDGRPLTCKSCGSFRHFLRDCPDSWEKLNSVNITSQEIDAVSNKSRINVSSGESVVLFTGFDKSEIARFGVEAQGCAVLDSACSSTVCGKTWLEGYLSMLSEADKLLVENKYSHRVFRFGGGTQLVSLGEYSLPACLVGNRVTIKTDVVESDIPLLLSRQAMKAARVKMDLENDSAEIMGKSVVLNITSCGHYCVPLYGDIRIEHVNSVKLDQLSDSERLKTLLKLHRQFAHPRRGKLEALLRDAGVWQDKYSNDLEKIENNCVLCKQFTRTPPRPVVGLPMARKFNQVVAMDLKHWEGGKWILYLIDMWSRYTQSAFINRKRSTDVIDQIMKLWVGTFGVMEGILHDNGGEFNSEEMRGVASILDVRINTTAAESPFQNGLCERIHAVTDMMLVKLKAQFPQTPVEVLLRWSNMARNSLQMWNGFSSHQLVFGENPNLPNIMTDKIPALEGMTSCEVFAKHLNALHASRQAFIQTEAEERVRRALRSKVRVAEQVFNPGDFVFYKREGHDRWLGPGKVICQDGKLIFVRHGGVIVRVSPNRLIKQGSEFEVGSGFVADNAAGGVDDVEWGLESMVQSDLRETRVEVDGDGSGEEQPEDLSGEGGGDENQPIPKMRLQKGEDGCWSIYAAALTRDEQNTPECFEAKQAELKKLQDFDTYEEAPYWGQKCISTRWVVTGKESGIKARLVARGFEEESTCQSDSPTIGKSAIRLFLAVVASVGWEIRTTDIKSAFLQGRDLERDVYVLPPKEVRKEGIVWKLKKCLYGLGDASRQFYLSVREEMQNLGCMQCTVEPSLFYKLSGNGELEGILVSHIDDFLHAGTDLFRELVMKPLRTRFVAGRVEEGNFSYVGFKITQNDQGIVLDQSSYVQGVEMEQIDQGKLAQRGLELSGLEKTGYRSIVGAINWIVRGSRPDMAFDMVELAVRANCATVEDLIKARKVLRRLQEFGSYILFPCISSPWSLYVFTDASLANLSDGVSSSLGIVIFVTDGNRSSPLAWHANKIKRVVRSTLAAESLALLEGLEEALYLRSVLMEIHISTTIPIVGFVDNKSLVEAIYSTKLVNDKRLRIDIGAIKEMLKSDIEQVKWLPGSSQLANCLTKRGASGEQLLTVFRTGRLGNIEL